METLNEKLKESADKLIAQGASFWATTRGAGEGFVSRTRTAGEQFWSEAVEASGELLSQTKQAQKGLLGSVQQEADSWLTYFRTEGGKLDVPRLKAAPGAAIEAVKVPNPREVERRLLLGLGGALQDFEAKVQARIQLLDSRALPAPGAPSRNGTAKKNGNGNGKAPAKKLTDESVDAAKAPLAGYDDLTAKEIVTKLAKLEAKKVEALLEYEQGTKNRATVVSAMRARLEA